MPVTSAPRPFISRLNFELPFSTEEDAAREGNSPYDSIVNGVPYDIEDYFTQVYP